MLMRLDPAWLMLAISLVAIICFFFGALMDAIMKEDGFGPIGNTLVLLAGFFAGIFLVNYNGITLTSLGTATATGLGGSFVSLALLALVKAGLARL